MSRQPQRVLVIAPAWVGDMIMSQVIYSALREEYPDIEIDVLAPSATLPLIRRMPEVNRGILIDQTHGQFGLGYRFRLGAELEKNNYDWAIITPNSLKSALVPFAANIPLRTGFLGEYRYLTTSDAGNRHGGLVAVERHVGKNLKVGAGYNFARFDDDLKNEGPNNLDYDAQGWFINVVGKY